MTSEAPAPMPPEDYRRLGPHTRPVGAEATRQDENPYCMKCSRHLGMPFHETSEHEAAA